MPNTVPELLKQVLENQQQLNTRVETVGNGVTAITTRLDEQDVKIKTLTDAIVGTAENPGLVTKMALAQDHIKRIEDRLEKREKEVDDKLAKNDTQTDANKADLREVTTRLKMVSWAIGLSGGVVGAGGTEILKALLGGG